MGRRYSTNSGMRKAYSILIEEPDVKVRLVYNIKMDFKKVEKREILL
jgi:hypothetical protein